MCATALNIHKYVTYVCTFIHTYICTYIHTYMHAYIRMYEHTYIHTSYVHTHTHTHTSPATDTRHVGVRTASLPRVSLFTTQIHDTSAFSLRLYHGASLQLERCHVAHSMAGIVAMDHSRYTFSKKKNSLYSAFIW